MKKDIKDLAIFSGKPLFDRTRPIGQLWMPDKKLFYDHIESIYQEKRITNNGPLVRRLEAELVKVHKCKYCVAFANASIAIIAVLKLVARKTACSIGGDVILPSFTYSGLPHLVRWAGYEPKFVDVDESTHVISAIEAEAVITDNTVAILAVHQVNCPADIDSFNVISGKYNIPVVYDSVHGVFGAIDGVPIGNFGEAEIFSLHATKLINGFEGGYVTTNQKLLAAQLKTIRNFGIIKEDATSMLGLNGKLNEVHAALALASLKDRRKVVSHNKHRFKKYTRAFANVPNVTWVDYPPTTGSGKKADYNYEFFLLKIPEDWPLTRNEILQLLRAEGALARGYYDPPVHLSSHFPGYLPVPSLPVTEKLSSSYIQMPVGELVGDDDIRVLSSWFRFIYNNANAIKVEMHKLASV